MRTKLSLLQQISSTCHLPHPDIGIRNVKYKTTTKILKQKKKSTEQQWSWFYGELSLIAENEAQVRFGCGEGHWAYSTTDPRKFFQTDVICNTTASHSLTMIFALQTRTSDRSPLCEELLGLHLEHLEPTDRCASLPGYSACGSLCSKRTNHFLM